MDRYGEARNFPSLKGPELSGCAFALWHRVHPHTWSTWPCSGCAAGSARVLPFGLAELAWRDFYFQILANFPRVARHAFKPEYDHIQWESGEQADSLVRRRGAKAAPVTRSLMRPWPSSTRPAICTTACAWWPEAFWSNTWGWIGAGANATLRPKLNDFDLSANNGGWQWVASSGCDAQPYFRIFNPVTQSEKL